MIFFTVLSWAETDPENSTAMDKKIPKQTDFLIRLDLLSISTKIVFSWIKSNNLNFEIFCQRKDLFDKCQVVPLVGTYLVHTLAVGD